jgi:hypothetical protein
VDAVSDSSLFSNPVSPESHFWSAAAGDNLHRSYRTLRDGSFGVAVSQALRARLRSHRPSGTFRNVLAKLIVRARMTGYFPGNTVELDNIFKLSGDKIASLEIRS